MMLAKPKHIALFFTLILTMVTSQSFATVEAKENVNKIEKHIVIEHSDDGTSIADIDLGLLTLGSNNVTTIVLKNGFSQPIEFRGASVDCNCIAAKVPKKIVLNGMAEKLVFELNVGKDERRTEKSFGITIQSSGGTDRIILRMKAKIAGVVSIGANRIVVETEKNSDVELKLTRRVAITVSDQSLLKDAIVSFSSELSDRVDGSVCFGDDGAFLELNIRVGAMKESSLTGQLLLTGSAFSQRAIEFTIRQKPPFEMHPGSLVFNSASDTSLSASAIVRAKKGLIRNGDDLEVSCTLPCGKSIQSICRRLADGIYLVEFEIDKAASEEYRNSRTQVAIEMKTLSSKELFTIPTRITW